MTLLHLTITIADTIGPAQMSSQYHYLSHHCIYSNPQLMVKAQWEHLIRKILMDGSLQLKVYLDGIDVRALLLKGKCK